MVTIQVWTLSPFSFDLGFELVECGLDCVLRQCKKLVLATVNSAPILHSVGAVCVRVCESTTGYTFIFYFPWTPALD